MREPVRSQAARESGQTLILYALMVAAMIGILGLVIDLGFLFAQRRFDQNGADAGALAAGRMLSYRVSTRPGGIYFDEPDWLVYNQVVRYAGLTPRASATSTLSSEPTGVNQNPLLNGRNRLAVALEYSPDGVTWCYSPSGWLPPGATVCSLVQGTFPPYPDGVHPYRLRVTVGSTTESFLSPFVGTATPDNCPRPEDGSGSTTCASAVVSIRGVPKSVYTGPVIPVTTGWCEVTPPVEGHLMQLWTSSPNDCGSNLGGWKNMLDFTKEAKWCDSPGVKYDYKYNHLLPSPWRDEWGAEGTSACKEEADSTSYRQDTWSRSAPYPGTAPDADDFKAFVPDSWDGQNDDATSDVVYWIAAGFNGKIWASPDSGNKMPTYEDSDPGQVADGGSNISVGFYCDNKASASAPYCNSDKNPAKTYFFQPYQPGFQPDCSGEYEWRTVPAGLGCRDVGVPIWAQPEWAFKLNDGGTKWTNDDQGGGPTPGPPDRVRIIEILKMRIYCEYNGNLCTRPPGSLVGNYATSGVWGIFLGEGVTACPEGQVCDTPTIYGNYASLEE